MEVGVNYNAAVGACGLSSHGDLNVYLEALLPVAGADPDFLAHLVAWNARSAKVRDSLAALPAISLAYSPRNTTARENAYACMAELSPRDLIRSLKFFRSIENKPFRARMDTQRFVARYLRGLELAEKDVLLSPRVYLHRRPINALFQFYHVPMSERMRHALRENDEGFALVVASLRNMTPEKFAWSIREFRVPFLVYSHAVGPMLEHHDAAVAIVDTMSPAELVTNMKMFERRGLLNVPAVRAAIDQKLAKPKAKASAQKMTRAVEAIDNTEMKARVAASREKAIDASYRPKGNALILADRSASMEQSIKVARLVAAALSRYVDGRVYLCWFNSHAAIGDVTGWGTDQIDQACAGVVAGGGTAIGVGLDAALEKGYDVDAVFVISDGEQMSGPSFSAAYARFEKATQGKRPVVAFFECTGGRNTLGIEMKSTGIEYAHFDIRSGQVDYHSIPDLVRTVRFNRHGLYQEIMDTPLRALKLPQLA